MTESNMETAQDGIIGVRPDEVDRIRQAIRALPDTVPPRAVWDRIEELGKAEGLLKSGPNWSALRWVAGAAVAATVAMLAIRVPAPTPAVDGETFSTVPSYESPATNSGASTLQALMVQSQLLERNLRAIPDQPRVMRAGTAATMAQLEDRIFDIDFVLNHPGANLSNEQKRFYWQERVRLMNALLQLRYAQARKAAF
jgi:hypothetical protein